MISIDSIDFQNSDHFEASTYPPRGQMPQLSEVARSSAKPTQ